MEERYCHSEDREVHKPNGHEGGQIWRMWYCSIRYWDFLVFEPRILLSEIFLSHRIFYRSGYKKAIVALARKILKLVWHLLTNDELYQETETLLTKSAGSPA